jgi:hypothetical protein
MLTTIVAHHEDDKSRWGLANHSWKSGANWGDKHNDFFHPQSRQGRNRRFHHGKTYAERPQGATPKRKIIPRLTETDPFYLFRFVSRSPGQWVLAPPTCAPGGRARNRCGPANGACRGPPDRTISSSKEAPNRRAFARAWSTAMYRSPKGARPATDFRGNRQRNAVTGPCRNAMTSVNLFLPAGTGGSFFASSSRAVQTTFNSPGGHRADGRGQARNRMARSGPGFGPGAGPQSNGKPKQSRLDGGRSVVPRSVSCAGGIMQAGVVDAHQACSQRRL